MDSLKFLSTTLVLSSLLITSNAYSNEVCDYYVDNINGNDANSGHASANVGIDGPWKTLGRVLAKSAEFIGGDRICFRKGGRFYNKNNGVLRSSGDAVNGPITYTSYGEGDIKPVLSVSKNTNSNINGNFWTPLNDGTNRYEYVYGGCYVAGLWEDGAPLKRVSTQNLADGEWYFPAYPTYSDCTSSDPATRNILYKPTNLGDSVNPDYSLDGRVVMMSNNSQIFALNRAGTSESLSYITFDGLAFEYAGVGIAGVGRGMSATGEPLSVNHITVQNSDFNHVVDGINLYVSSIAHENHHISVINNRFEDIRFATSFMAGATGVERHFNIDIIGNVVRGISLNAAYVNGNSPDVEVFRFQNPWDLSIIGNDVRHSVKASDGYTTQLSNGTTGIVRGNGIVIWRQTSPLQELKRINIHNNRFDDLGIGVVLSAGVGAAVEDVYISNNIITNSEIGIRLNSAAEDAINKPVIIYNNTLVGNEDSVYINSNGSGYQLKNNISAWPTKSHVTVVQYTGYGQTQFNHNLYVDTNNSVDLFSYFHTGELLDFMSWQNVANRDPGSLVATDAGFVGGNLQTIPDDDPEIGNAISGAPYRLTASSVAINNGANNVGITEDFFGEARILTPDIGAVEFLDSDADGI